MNDTTTSVKGRMRLDDARLLADRLAELLSPACTRVQVVGSVRRAVPYVGDLELLIVPMYEAGMFPGQVADSKLDTLIDQLIAGGELRPGPRNGEKHKTVLVPTPPGCSPAPGAAPGAAPSAPVTIPGGVFAADLFIVRPWQWGVSMVVRTGPAEYSRSCVTQRVYGGLLRDDCKVNDWRVWQTCQGDGPGQRKQINTAPDDRPPRMLWFQAQDTPEEQHFFDFLLGGWVDPKDRR